MSESTALATARLFIERLNTNEGVEKNAAAVSNYIRDKVREDSVLERCWPSVSVTPKTPNMQRSTQHDQFVYIDEIEPGGKAMTIAFREEPEATYVDGLRYEIPFFKISTDRVQKDIEEFDAYSYDIMGWFRRTFGNFIENVQDYRWLVYLEAAAQYTGRIAKGEQAVAYTEGGGAGTFRGKLQRDDLTTLQNLFSANESKINDIVIPDADYNDAQRWEIEKWGDQKVGEITTSGLNTDKFIGVKIHRSIKSRVFQPGNIYGLAARDFVGRHFTLRPVDFMMQKDFKLISMQSQTTKALSIANIRNVGKVELYAGSSDALISESLIDAYVSNAVAEGGVFPNIEL